MTTLELARKLDQCLAAQVKLQKERDAAIAVLRELAQMADDDAELSEGTMLQPFYVIHAQKIRAALAQMDEAKL